jgi:hypothetical protein
VAPDVILSFFLIVYTRHVIKTKWCKKKIKQRKIYQLYIYRMPTIIVYHFFFRCVGLCHLLSFVFEAGFSSCWCNFVFTIVIEERIPHSGFAGPWEDLRTRLTGAHVANARFMPSVANFGGIAPLRSLLDISNNQYG